MTSNCSDVPSVLQSTGDVFAMHTLLAEKAINASSVVNFKLGRLFSLKDNIFIGFWGGYIGFMFLLVGWAAIGGFQVVFLQVRSLPVAVRRSTVCSVLFRRMLCEVGSGSLLPQ